MPAGKGRIGANSRRPRNVIERLPKPLHEAISRLLRNISLPVAVGPEEPSSRP